jgi:hypothetical protein
LNTFNFAPEKELFSMDPVASSPFLVPVYIAYAVIALGLTVGLARVLFRSGAVFLEDVFKDTPKMAEAVNRLLVVGFYLLNLGYAALIMKATGAFTAVEAAEVLAWKLGALLVSLGVMHFFNMYLFFRIRRRSQLAVLPPPVAPQLRLPMSHARSNADHAAQAAAFPHPVHVPIA